MFSIAEKRVKITPIFKNSDRVFDSWIIQDCVEKKNEYVQYAVQSEDDQTSASFWVVDFPATADDLAVLEENGMSHEEAIIFFKQAAEDFVGSLAQESNSETFNSLLPIIRSEMISNDDNTASVLLLTKSVYSISSVLTRGYLPVEEVIKIGMQLCDAVINIKNNNLPRRLLTIDNIFADYEGNYSLGCFGNASDTRFQSPEEHRGEPSLYNADVNSIGVILYTLLNENRLPLLPAGNYAPTEDEIAEAVQNRHAGVPLPPPRHNSVAFTGIVLKACAYKSKARFASAEEFRSALDNLRSGHVVVVSSEDLRKDRQSNEFSSYKKLLSSVITILVIILVSGFIVQLITDNDPPAAPVVEPTQEVTSDGITVIFHTDPVIDPTVLPTEQTPLQVQDSTASSPYQQYPDSFFDQIAVYHSGQYHLKGVMEQKGEIKPTELAVTTENSIYMTSDIDGSFIGILRAKDGNVYLVDPVAKSYLELSKTILRMLGMDTDAIDQVAGSIQGNSFSRPDEVYRVMYREQELVCCSYTYDSGKQELFYLDDSGVLQYIESYSSESALENVMIVESISDAVPPEFIAPVDSYKMCTGIKGLIEFVSGLTPSQS